MVRKSSLCNMSASSGEATTAEHPQLHRRRHQSRNKKHDPFLELSGDGFDMPEESPPSMNNENSSARPGSGLVEVTSAASCVR